MNRIVVCLDCPYYRKGGYCTLKQKDVGALNPACENAGNTANETDRNNFIKSKKMEKLAPTKETKLCTKCGRELPISEFYAKTGTKDGLAYRCKECHTAEVIESRARKKANAQPATAQEPKQVVVRETLTDKQMVEALRAHGWTVTCTRTTTEEL